MRVRVVRWRGVTAFVHFETQKAFLAVASWQKLG